MNRTSNARKQNSAAISHPSLLTDCQMALTSGHSLSQNAQDQVTSERGGHGYYYYYYYYYYYIYMKQPFSNCCVALKQNLSKDVRLK
jgi:hypothetical protein